MIWSQEQTIIFIIFSSIFSISTLTLGIWANRLSSTSFISNLLHDYSDLESYNNATSDCLNDEMYMYIQEGVRITYLLVAEVFVGSVFLLLVHDISVLEVETVQKAVVQRTKTFLKSAFYLYATLNKTDEKDCAIEQHLTAERVVVISGKEPTDGNTKVCHKTAVLAMLRIGVSFITVSIIISSFGYSFGNLTPLQAHTSENLQLVNITDRSKWFYRCVLYVQFLTTAFWSFFIPLYIVAYALDALSGWHEEIKKEQKSEKLTTRLFVDGKCFLLETNWCNQLCALILISGITIISYTIYVSWTMLKHHYLQHKTKGVMSAVCVNPGHFRAPWNLFVLYGLTYLNVLYTQCVLLSG